MQLVSQQDSDTFKNDVLAILHDKDKDIRSLRTELDALKTSNANLRNELDALKESNTARALEPVPDDLQNSLTTHSLARVGQAVGDPYGGAPFDDSAGAIMAHSPPRITFIGMHACQGDRIRSISYELLYPDGSRTSFSHGKREADNRKLELHNEEYIVSLVIGTGPAPWPHTEKTIQYLKCITNEGRELEGGKRDGRDCVEVSAPENEEGKGKWGLIGFVGRSWDEVDSLSPIWGAVY
ncbi:hypothetical protein CYLTODRAFT_459363 [Cylindrobasidium torrendii FP15055 ss-10]|uniref:Jacalin-type lectin domain-containing protein n=1 Tax=Cylindrobasidium torrendii FP15055 ss-10 TaxID=1314674 RepID=A0A0D7AVH5_9AGAR|nr:hypothetical protein CYLTODRAFT_459363 [Cylindrobasidium torrendii FP15055 ss-10]